MTIPPEPRTEASPVPLPSWSEFMVPVLNLLSDGEVHRLRDIRQVTAAQELSPAQQAIRLPSGEPKADNRIGWAVSYLTRVDALERPNRGEYLISDSGRELLKQYPHGISEGQLRAHARPGDQWWTSTATSSNSDTVVEPLESSEPLDPTEQIEQGIARIHADVAADLLARLHGQDATFFEVAVVKLLVAMGYGGADGRATVTSPGNDGGIDGIIDQDTLGLNRVYVQAKRYAPDSAVQRPELQAFVGALSGKADGGVFITTGRFTSGAVSYAASIPTRIILVDGRRLTDLMIRYGVGVQTSRTVHVVEVDEDFFE